jgi:hypothetical protein
VRDNQDGEHGDRGGADAARQLSGHKLLLAGFASVEIQASGVCAYRGAGCRAEQTNIAASQGTPTPTFQ